MLDGGGYEPSENEKKEGEREREYARVIILVGTWK